jgi:hypothetical protein
MEAAMTGTHPPESGKGGKLQAARATIRQILPANCTHRTDLTITTNKERGRACP